MSDQQGINNVAMKLLSSQLVELFGDSPRWCDGPPRSVSNSRQRVRQLLPGFPFSGTKGEGGRIWQDVKLLRALGRMCLEPPVLRTLNEQGAVVPASGSESSLRRSVCPPPEGNALLVGRRAYNSSRRDLLGIRGDGPSLGDFASMYEA